MDRDYSISIIRVLATFFIIICHLGNHVFHSPFIAQSFNIGVTVFFIISGYLYSKKEINNEKKWILNRFVRIYMPLLATTIVMLFIYKINYLFIYNFLDLQGINHIIGFVKIKTLIHPWFLTVIMICYLLLIPTKRIEKKYDIFATFTFLCIFFLIVLGFIFCKFYLISIFTFYVGYYFGKIKINEKVYNKYWVFVLGFILLCGLRILCKKFFDNTVLYDDILVPLIKIFSSLCFIFFIKSIDYLYKSFHNFCKWKLIYFLDMISVYIYVMHSFFINDFSVFKLGLNLPFALVLYFVVVIAFSYVSYLIFEKIGDILRNKINR